MHPDTAVQPAMRDPRSRAIDVGHLPRPRFVPRAAAPRVEPAPLALEACR